MSNIWYTASFNVPENGKVKAYTATKIIDAYNLADAQAQAESVARQCGKGVTVKGLVAGLKVR